MARDLSDEDFAAIERYWAAFGRFINYFSQVEQRLHTLLWELSEAPIELVRVAFADARFDKVTTMIKRLYDSRGEAEHPLYRRAIDHLGQINSMRNDLVHYGASILVLTDEDDPDFAMPVMIVSNQTKAIPGRGRDFSVDIETLDNMTRDLRTALACMTVVLADKNQTPNRMAYDTWLRIAQQPWLYKPQPRSGGVQERRKPRPER